MSATYVASLLTPVLIDAIAVLGLYVIVNSGRLSVAQAVFVALGSYSVGVMYTKFGLPLWVGALVAIGVAALIGLVVALLLERLDGWFYAVGTIAFTQIAIGVFSNMKLVGGAIGMYGLPSTVSTWTAGLALVAVAIFVLGLDATRWGREARAVRDSPTAAAALGCNVRWIHMRSFTIGAAIAGFAGALRVGYLGFVDPTEASFDRSLLFLVYLAIGGRSSVPGAVIAAILLGLLPNMFGFLGEYQLEFYGAAVALIMIVRPSGLVPNLAFAGLRTRLAAFMNARGRTEWMARKT